MMEHLLDPRVQGAILTIASSVGGFLFLLIQGTSAWKNIKAKVGERNIKIALDALRGAVTVVYHTYVKKAKTKRNFSEELQKKARTDAVNEAVRLSGERGVDLRQTLGSDAQIVAHIEQTITDLKKPPTFPRDLRKSAA